MGLDQYAFSRAKDEEIALERDEDGFASVLGEYDPEALFTRGHDEKAGLWYWRKHAKLHEFMRQCWLHRGSPKDLARPTDADGEQGALADEFVGVFEIDRHMVSELARMLEAGNELPQSPGGFFFGHQFQDESAREYRARDRAFVAWALEQLSAGRRVFYDSSW